MEFRLMVTGDPINDVYSFGYFDENRRWCHQYTEQRNGGAANTYLNAVAINGRPPSVSVYVSQELPQSYKSLIRLISHNEKKLYAEFWDHYTDMNKMYRIPSNRFRPWKINKRFGLIISEYNKGTCNSKTNRRLPAFDFAVVDSRYRTVHPSWFETAKVKIWHATGAEYDDEWSNQFDYVIHTDGPGEVVVFGNTERMAEIVEVPDTPIVDTCGAGDTLTAAVGVYLAWWRTQNQPILMDVVVQATKFGVWCAQDVVNKPLTAVTDRTLQEYLNL